MINIGSYETVDGLMVEITNWNAVIKQWGGYVQDYPLDGNVHFTSWDETGIETSGRSELDLDLQEDFS